MPTIIPSKDAEFNSYLGNVKPYLNTNKVRLKISSAHITSLNGSFGEWNGTDGTNGIYAASQNENTVTKTITNKKNNLKKILTGILQASIKRC